MYLQVTYFTTFSPLTMIHVMLCNHDQCEQHPSEITFKLCIISSMFQIYHSHHGHRGPGCRWDENLPQKSEKNCAGSVTLVYGDCWATASLVVAPMCSKNETSSSPRRMCNNDIMEVLATVQNGLKVIWKVFWYGVSSFVLIRQQACNCNSNDTQILPYTDLDIIV